MAELVLSLTADNIHWPLHGEKQRGIRRCRVQEAHGGFRKQPSYSC
jgi:hypothetical protein